MLRPVLEIYVLWHPGDGGGALVAQAIAEHFHGTPFTGLIGGAIEVLVRSEGWEASEGSPRPIPFQPGDLPADLAQSAFVAVVPLMGFEMASALEGRDGEWHTYVASIAAAQEKNPQRVGVFPYQIDADVLSGTVLGEILGKYQRIAVRDRGTNEEELPLLCRDLSQGIAQMIEPNSGRLTVFLSHTKRGAVGSLEDISGLVDLVRRAVARTRLREYFDASDLQPGQDWDAELRHKAAQSAMLAIRTDLYASREWCQREVRIAKQNGMPVVFLDVPGPGEERGSFLMDHAPRLPVKSEAGAWDVLDVYRALNLMVDECLKRVLWRQQERLTKEDGTVSVWWWAPHAPEPVTLLHWIESQKRVGAWPTEQLQLVVLHPDPPLGPDERMVLDQVLEVAGSAHRLDVMTPRLLAARGG